MRSASHNISATLELPSRASKEVIRTHIVAFWLAANAALALVMFQSRAAATLHALSTLGLGLWWAYARRLDRVAYVVAYIAGAEVLWRMCDAYLNWEYGKYSLILLIAVALSRSKRLKPPMLPLFYFVLFLPSAWLTGEQLEWGMARRVISFNLSGPLALFMCAWLCSRLALTPGRLRILLLALIGPIIGIVANAVFHTLSLTSVQFAGASDSALSGGFGPNQVSSVLGLGIVAAIMYIMAKKVGTIHRGIILTVALLFLVQSGLTFSRSGIAMALGSIVVASFFLLKDGRSRLSLLTIGVFLYLFVRLIMIPVLDDFTKGAFVERFTDISSTHRDEIAMTEIELFLEHPAFGVGPGQASVQRAEMHGNRVAAHTEFTRVLAEHGALGLIALGLLMFAAYKNIRQARRPKTKAFVASMLTWSFLFFLVNGFRLAAPALAFGLTFAMFMPSRIFGIPADSITPTPRPTGEAPQSPPIQPPEDPEVIP